MFFLILKQMKIKVKYLVLLTWLPMCLKGEIHEVHEIYIDEKIKAKNFANESGLNEIIELLATKEETKILATKTEQDKIV